MKFTLCLVLGVVASTSTYAHYDSSGTTNCPSLCTDIYEPVCGSNGETYANECYLSLADCESQEHITLVHNGKCDTPETTSTDSSGSDGCPTVCTLIFKPVCGSDGVTYGNDCLLDVAQCQSGGAITKVSEGECPETSNVGSESGCSDVCIEIFRPVCGSDGVTYPNSCFLGRATCKDPNITLAHNEACEGTNLSSEGSYEAGNPSTYSSGSTNCPDTCIEILRPVCGSDGVTYANSCFLEVASCNDPNITLAHNGACEGTSLSTEGSNENNSTSTESSQETTTGSETSSNSSSCPSVCPDIYAPVCGSDGVTYGNECKLEVASCNHPELCLKKVSDGACSPVECKTY